MPVMLVKKMYFGQPIKMIQGKCWVDSFCMCSIIICDEVGIKWNLDWVATI